MYFIKEWLDTHRLLLFSCLLFLFGGTIRLLAGLSCGQAFLPAGFCIVGSVAVWKFYSPLKRIRFRTFTIGIPAVLFLCWFFNWKRLLSWLPGLLSPLVISALFFPKSGAFTQNECCLLCFSVWFCVGIRRCFFSCAYRNDWFILRPGG